MPVSVLRVTNSVGSLVDVPFGYLLLSFAGSRAAWRSPARAGSACAVPGVSSWKLFHANCSSGAELLPAYAVNSPLASSSRKCRACLARSARIVSRTASKAGSPRIGSRFGSWSRKYQLRVRWETLNRVLAYARACQCDEAFELRAGLSMLSRLPETLGGEIPRQEAAAALAKTAEREPREIGILWNDQRQAEAMIGHDVTGGQDATLANAAKRVRSEMFVIVGADDYVVTPRPALEFATLAGARSLVLDADCGHGILGVTRNSSTPHGRLSSIANSQGLSATGQACGPV